MPTTARGHRSRQLPCLQRRRCQQDCARAPQYVRSLCRQGVRLKLSRGWNDRSHANRLDRVFTVRGWPVVMPTVNAFVITPVAPHSLTHRPLVVPDSVEIEILMRSEEEVAYLSLDGQPGLDLRDGDRVRCRRSEHQVSIFRTGTDFFHLLRTKLKWGERQD